MKNLKNYLILSMIFGLSFLAYNVKAMTFSDELIEGVGSTGAMWLNNFGCTTYSNQIFTINNTKFNVKDGISSHVTQWNVMKSNPFFNQMEYTYLIYNSAISKDLTSYGATSKKWYSIVIIFNGKFNFHFGTNDSTIKQNSTAPIPVNEIYAYPLENGKGSNYYIFNILFSAEEDSTETYIVNSYTSDTASVLYGESGSSGTALSENHYIGNYYVRDIKQSSEYYEPKVSFKYKPSLSYTPAFTNTLSETTNFYQKYNPTYCSLEGNFILTKEEIKDSVSEELIGERLTAKFDSVDTDKYKYEFIDVNATDTRTEFKPGEDKTYEWFYLKNNATCVYVTEKSTNEQIGSNCEIESNLNDSKEFITFNYDESKDEYIEVDGKKILYAKYVFAKLNISPFEYTDLKNKYLFFEYYTDTKEDFGAINGATYLTENSKMNFIIVGLNTGVQYQTSVDFSKKLDDVNNLPEQISWKEECNDDKTSCRVGVRFINYDEDKHQYYVSDDSEATYKQVYPRLFNKDDVGNYYFDDTEEIKTYCAEIRDGKDTISRSCYTTSGFTSTASFKSFIKRLKNFINDQTNTINHISNLIQKMYLLVDHRIRTFLETMYFLACLIAVIWNIRR